VHHFSICRTICCTCFGFRQIHNKENIFFHVRSSVVANLKECSLGEGSIEVLPGQYFDKETNTHYNYFRDYDPSQGRYVESDPIGLRGGINTYAYAMNQPLVRSDSLGLRSKADISQSPCGADGGRRYSDQFPGWTFTAACDAHDRCYATCRRPKLECDRDFYMNMRSQCRGLSIGLRLLCEEAAYEYYTAVFYGGWGAYKDSQAKACQGSTCPN